ncbi:Ribosomal protein L10/acidic P0 [Kalmanozyma brasiliensis GHG001]|uniref:Ribosome assembly factor mrt4 n=1 Tax=Kalmanozyma brasiliensis (strain GHG001) TaxID=1365824 RepID=V5F0T0_KALBG|nr:Ribosomal protein L10/acidic P0 [Kalmanozyma brasiliensis GHG001]EST09933.1 Ribosomal protein L10/acidic P0 [Kalmanozyma brasiliensis GHG001]
MPRAKRAKVVSLTRTDKKTKEDKANLIDKVRDAAQEYPYVWILGHHSMRNNYLKEVRDLWKGSKIFFGKLKVLALALGMTEEEEVRTGISGISQRLSGDVGLLFTESSPAEVIDWFKDYQREDFARGGSKATETIELPEGPVMARSNPPDTLPHPVEPQLRQLGMPTELKRGIPTLLQSYTVCKEGQTLTSSQAQVLKHILVHMAHFRLIPLAYWSAADAEEDKGERGVHLIDLSKEDQALVGKQAGKMRAPTDNGWSRDRKSNGAAGKANSEDVEEESDEEMNDDEDDEDDQDAEDAVTKDMMMPEGL